MPDPVRTSPRPPAPSRTQDAATEQRLRTAFLDADNDGDGALSKEEATTQLRRSGLGVFANHVADRFDADRDGQLSWQEAKGLTGNALGTGLQRIEQQDPLSLAGRLDRTLPQDRFDAPWQRDRVLERANGFEREVRTLAADAQSPDGALGGLRSSLGDAFDPSADIELHGVASHLAPETMQAHVRDREGNRHVFVRDSDGAWQGRPDLAQLADAGSIPSRAPGLRRDREGGTATFGVATVKANGDFDIAVPDVSRFDHAPRSHPFAVGDVVQLSHATGDALTRAEGQPFKRPEDVRFGRITGNDGQGNWTIEQTQRDGSARLGDDGQPLTTTLTDAELRRTNNPTLLRDGVAVYDARFLPNDPAQRQMIDQWHGSDERQALMASRPGPNAPVAERASWERRAIDAADSWLHERMVYPDSKADLDGKRERLTTLDERIGEIDRRLATPEGANDGGARMELETLSGQRQELAADVEKGERYHEMTERQPPPSIGEYFTNGTGQCRQQAIAGQVLMQDLGIDSRMTRGAANTGTGNYRGEHMWLETTLSDGSNMLVDPTWTSPGSRPGDLRDAYDGDLRRQEVPSDTERDYRNSIASITPVWTLGGRRQV